MSNSAELADTVTNKQKTSPAQTWGSWLIYIVIVCAVYFGNTAVQTYLGERALAQTGMKLISMEEALSRAQAEGKPILADMSAIWCPSCRKLDQRVFSNDAVKQAIADDYVFTRVEYETEEGKALVEKYGVRGFPTLLVLDENGNFIHRLALTFDPQQFINMIKVE